MYSKIPLPDINPALLYDLRQVVRNSLIVRLAAVYLASMVLFLGLGLGYKDNWVVAHLLSHGMFYDNLGFQLMFGLLCMFYGYTTILLVAFGAVRLSMDRINEHAALQTTLPPWRIVSGKLQFGLVVGLLLASMTLPFLAASYLMRGVDLRTILYGMFWFFAMTQLHYALTVAMLSGAKTMRQAVARSIPMVLMQFFLAFFFYILLIIVVWVGLPELTFLTAAVAPGVGGTLLILLLALMATVQLAPENSNRMLPVRLMLTLLFLVLAAMVPIAAYIGSAAGPAAPWRHWSTFVFVLFDAFGSVVMPCFLLIFICERDAYSTRIRRTIPKSLPWRLLCFPFYTGAANALCWAVLFFLAWAAVVLSASPRLENWWSFELWRTLGFDLVFFAWGATILLLHRLFLHRYYSREWNWAPLVGFYVVLACLAFLEAFFGHLVGMRGFVEEIARVPCLPIPWGDIGESGLATQFVIAGVWLTILFGLNFRALRRRFAEFRNA